MTINRARLYPFRQRSHPQVRVLVLQFADDGLLRFDGVLPLLDRGQKLAARHVAGLFCFEFGNSGSKRFDPVLQLPLLGNEQLGLASDLDPGIRIKLVALLISVTLDDLGVDVLDGFVIVISIGLGPFFAIRIGDRRRSLELCRRKCRAVTFYRFQSKRLAA